MDTSNRFEVRLIVEPQGSVPRVLVGRTNLLGPTIRREDAVNLASWLLALADPRLTEFRVVFAKITESERGNNLPSG